MNETNTEITETKVKRMFCSR